MLPNKTFLTHSVPLYESDFDVSGQLKPCKVMENLQNIAADHAARLGFGWDALDGNSCLWVLSKIRIRFDRIIDKNVRHYTLYTWPLKPTRYFAERCFVALDDNGAQLFAATSIWLIIDRDSRKIVSSDRLAEIYTCDFDSAHCDVPAQFERFRPDDGFALCYERTMRRSDLDVNRHVNNTNYVNFALDALGGQERVREIEIVYHKELLLGDAVRVLCKRADGNAYIVGENGETCFTVKLTLNEPR